MAAFPQLLDEDFAVLSQALDSLRLQSGAAIVLLVEKAGYLIAQSGEQENLDTTQLAALASNSFNATQFIGTLLSENDFDSMYQKGGRTSLLILNVDEHRLIVALFESTVSAGAVRFYAAQTVRAIADQLQSAALRNPAGAISIVDLNPADMDQVFRRRAENGG